MGERKDLRDLLRDADFTQKRIIDDLASSGSETGFEERGVAPDIRKSEGGDFIKNIFVGLLLVGIVVGSFWISFLIGKKVLVPPVKNLQTVEMPAPKAISPIDIETAAPATEEMEIKEREITPAPVVEYKNKPSLAVKPKPKPRPVAVLTNPAPAVKPVIAKTKGMKFYKVIVGTYQTVDEANNLTQKLRENGFLYYVKQISGSFRVQAGAFDAMEKAQPLVEKLKAKGFTPTIIIE